MTASSCPDKSKLAAYLLGTIPEADAETIISHLEQCPSCEATVESMEGLSDTLVSGLRRPVVNDPFPQEPEYQQAIAELRGLGVGGVAGPAAEGVEAAEGTQLALGKLDEYRLLEKLGEGGMGVVYRAVHNRLEKVVALKVLPSRRVEDEVAVARFFEGAAQPPCGG
ncbi:MAG: zf-HC2 domain-containing protein [Pirellulales bacterium]|nr:zf-HC2 domain-containing protein [Pirellulales bacterium]